MIARLLALACVAACLTGAGYGDALREARRAAGAKQMAGAVLDGGRVVWTGAAGPGARPGDVYSLASLTKTYIAALAVERAEAGALSLDAPISTWLAGLIPAATGEVTMRELLDHTSGVPDYLDDPDVVDGLQDSHHRWTETELLRAVRAPTGRGTFSYSNTNYILAGAILRRVEGRGLAAPLAQRILAPVGATSTSLARSARLGRRVAGHHRLANDVWGPLWTDGGLVASAADVGRFLSGLVVRGKLLAPHGLGEMLGDGTGYGLGIYPVTLHGATYWGHDGSYAGWQSYALSSPSTGLTFVALARGGRISGPARAIEALSAAPLTSRQ
ncbi:MAG: serine hydrolase domain-containing protein [Solirubrobacteraceae bacterium]